MDSSFEREQTAKRIRALRQARELSIQRLADAAGMSAGYLSEVERGRCEISGVKLARLASTLGVTADYLLTGQGQPESSAAVEIPAALSEAAKALDLTYTQTLRLLAGKESLVARRSEPQDAEWNKEDWINFYQKVKPYL